MDSTNEPELRASEEVDDSVEVYEGDPDFVDPPWAQTDQLGVQDDVTEEETS